MMKNTWESKIVVRLLAPNYFDKYLTRNYTAAYGGKKRLDISPKVRIFWT